MITPPMISIPSSLLSHQTGSIMRRVWQVLSTLACFPTHLCTLLTVLMPSSGFQVSRVPKSLVDKSFHSWNKGRIQISDSEVEVVKAYEAQYAEDMECFLRARAQEAAWRGLITLITTGCPNGALYSQTLQSITYDLLGSCLMDMAKRGIVREEEVDSFNVPTYFMSPQELVAVVNRNGEFSIERMENLPQVKEVRNLPESQILASHLRAAMDGLIKEHFVDVILDELFELFRKKVEEELPLIKSGRCIDFFALLKRKAKE